MTRPDSVADLACVQTRNVALRLLGQREQGQAELAGKLRAKGHSFDVVAKVLRQLQDQGLQSDARFAVALVRRRIGRGYGPVYIRNELAERQVDAALATEALNQPDDYWLELAARALHKKFPNCIDESSGSHFDEADENGDGQYAAKARFLARRGFPAELVHRLLPTPS